MPRDEAASKNVTDLRRSRQHARAVMRNIQGEIITFLEEQGKQFQNAGSPREQAKQLNQAITQMAARELQNDLAAWLEERQRTTMARAARAAYEAMQQTLPRAIGEDDLFSSPNLTHRDRMLQDELNRIDAGLLYEDGDSLAEEIGDRVSRQIQIGFSKSEPVSSHRDDQITLSKRVKFVLTDGDGELRDEAGAGNLTAQTKAELIAHDSVQDAYVSAAHQRYLNNGFRYGVYDAVIDTKTSTVCRRLDEVVVDLVETPGLIPPNHPWCRSDLRPKLELESGEEPISESDIGDDHLKRIWQTNGFRPKAINTEQEFNPTALTDLMDQSA